MEQASIIILPTAVQALVNRSWEYSCQILWAKCHLREDEVENIKSWIANYYWSIDPNEFYYYAEEYFETFCKRVSDIDSSSQFSLDLYIFRNTLTAS